MFQQHTDGALPGRTLGQPTRRLAPALAGALIALAGAAEGLAQDRDPFGKSTGNLAADANVEVSEYMTVDLHVQDEDLANVLQMLSIQSQRNIVMSSDVSATVTANLYDVTFFEAMDSILNVNGYGYLERGNFIYVYTLEEIAQIEAAAKKPVYRVLKLDYLNANDAAEFVSPLLSEVGQIKTNGDVDAFSIDDEAPVGDETFALSATLVVVDYPENVEEIEKLVKQIDTRPSQVLVEATILQTQLNEANAFGVDFSLIGSLDFTDFTDTGGPLSASQSLALGGTGSSGEGFSPPDNNGTAVVSSPGNTTGPSTFKVGVVSDDFSVFLRLLDEVTDFTVLSNPKVLALNRQPARVLVGERIGFLNTTSTETSTTQSVEFLDTGTQLAFRPFVSNDGFIRMELKPRVSEGVIREATDVTGANVTIPDEITQELTTNVVVRDGSTIVLGGLFKETTRLTRRQVPVLGDIPIVGTAFRGHDDAIDRNEIIFMITPTIVNDNILISEGERAMDTIDRVRSGSRKGLLPWSRDKMSARLNVEAERLANEGNTRKAMWKLRRSLQLNPTQPDAIRLREELLNEYESWPTRSLLDSIFDGNVEPRPEGEAKLFRREDDGSLDADPALAAGPEGDGAGPETPDASDADDADAAIADAEADAPADEPAQRETAPVAEAVDEPASDAVEANPVTVVDEDGEGEDGSFLGAMVGAMIEGDDEQTGDAQASSEQAAGDAETIDFNEEFADALQDLDEMEQFEETAPDPEPYDESRQNISAPVETGETPEPMGGDAEQAAADAPAIDNAENAETTVETAAADERRLSPDDIVFDANGLPMVNVADTVPWSGEDYSEIVFFADVQVNGWAPVGFRGLSGLWRYFNDETSEPASTVTTVPEPDEDN